ncbi:MAG TPA: flagellar export protein FliJ [Candidatus Bathyarchaeia archaeon]|nr:flagellar export protein FliJ [Candidatus Bathyarchaeia archaeon]
MAFHFRLAPVLGHRRRLEDAAARDLAQAIRRLETLHRRLARIRGEIAARGRTIARSVHLGATGMELGQLARDVESLERLSITTVADAHAQREKTEQARRDVVEASRARQMLERLEESQRRAHDERREAVERREADETTAAGLQWRRAQTGREAKSPR